MSSGTLGYLLPNVDNNEPIRPTSNVHREKSTLSLEALLRIIKKLSLTLNELPDELKLPSLDENTRQWPNAYQFDIMRANIHITSLYLQSTILETCLSSYQPRRGNDASASTSPSNSADGAVTSPESAPEWSTRIELWKFRESIARELLELLKFCSSWTLEANGSSMVNDPYSFLH